MVWNIFYFSIYWESSSQLTNNFQRDSNHQPAKYQVDILLHMTVFLSLLSLFSFVAARLKHVQSSQSSRIQPCQAIQLPVLAPLCFNHHGNPRSDWLGIGTSAESWPKAKGQFLRVAGAKYSVTVAMLQLHRSCRRSKSNLHTPQFSTQTCAEHC